MAKHYKEINKEKNKNENKRKKKTFKVIYIILIIIIILCIGYIGWFLWIKYHNADNENILDNIYIDSNEITGEKTERMLKVEKLKKENPDIVGWLEIPDTSINYPVLQGEDNSYYMTHTYKKKKARNGSIFLDKDYDWNIPSSNLLMYGHNITKNTMFNELLQYENEKYYKKHPTINFTTDKEDAKYEIIAAFKSRVYYKSEKNVFRYYFFINANNKEEYDEFVTNAKKSSIYDTGKTAEYGDQLMTLSTCSYHTKDGRFAVIAKKVVK